MHFCEVKLYEMHPACACTGAKRACPAQVTEEPNREEALVKALQRATAGLKAELQRAGSDSSCNGTELQW